LYPVPMILLTRLCLLYTYIHYLGLFAYGIVCCHDKSTKYKGLKGS
jgi:hypothetical protein